MAQTFEGFNEDTYKFLIELAFNNNKAFFADNKERYKRSVQEPMRALAEDLLPTALTIDPSFNTNITSILSRIYRDTRFTKEKHPYRDHAWLAFRRPGMRMGESFLIYFEISPKSFGYGLGMHEGNNEMMNALRKRIQADPAGFLALTKAPVLANFYPEGNMYKRDRFPDADEKLKPYLNRKSLSWCYSSDMLSATLKPSLLGEVREAFEAIGPLYRYVMEM